MKAAESLPSFETYIQDYNANLATLRSVALKRAKKDKSNFATILYESGEIIDSFLNSSLDKVKSCAGESDFAIISLIRLLFLDKGKFNDPAIREKIEVAQQRICSALSSFPFWPASDDKTSQNVDDIVFWSENHLFMTLGSAHLFYQYHATVHGKQSPNYNAFVEQAFRKYLALHLHPKFGGVYEANSHVYLPYTMAALLNLYDFSKDESVRQQAEALIDLIVQRLMLTTDPLRGTATLSASARAFQRTRLRNHGHNLNQLVNLMLGRSPDPMDASALTDFVVTSSWRPKAEAFQALHFRGFVGQLRISHDLKDIDDIFGYNVLSPNPADGVDENLPLLWSGGLIVHPLFVVRTRNYQRRKHLTHNTHIWPLASSFLSDDFYERNMAYYGFLSAGQQYTDIKLNVYKQPGLVLSSFELFNPHMATFQQLPWMANVSGIPVWTQSGAGSESIGKFGMHNTHAPAVQQRGDVLVCTYLAPPLLTQGMIVGYLLSHHVRCFWPKQFFTGEEQNELVVQHGGEVQMKGMVAVGKGGAPTSSAGCTPGLSFFGWGKSRKELPAMTWTIGRIRDSFIGVLCTGETYWSNKETDDAILQPSKADVAVCVPRRVCESKRHTWVVVVGTTEHYKDIEDFAKRKCLSMRIAEMRGDKKSGDDGYRVNVEEGAATGGAVVNLSDEDHTSVGKRMWDEDSPQRRVGESKGEESSLQGVKITYVVPSMSSLGVHPLVAAARK